MSSDREGKRLIRIAVEYNNVRIYFVAPLTEFERKKVRYHVEEGLALDEEAQKPKPIEPVRTPVKKKRKRKRGELEDLVPEIKRKEEKVIRPSEKKLRLGRAMVAIKPSEPDVGDNDTLEQARDTVTKASSPKEDTSKEKVKVRKTKRVVKKKKKRKRKSELKKLIND
jgi:hypothetical protein